VPYRIIFGNPEKMNFNSTLFNDDFCNKTIILSLQNKLDKISKEVKTFFEKQ
jgi:hypothetical protein